MPFSNREIAAGIWLLVGAALAVSRSSDVRVSLTRLVRAFQGIIKIVLAMLGYVAACVWCAQRLGLWDVSLLKDTMLWVIGVAFVMVMNFERAQADRSFFSMTMRDAIALTAVIEFVAHFYSFPLWLEILVFPFVVLAALTQAMAELTKHKQAVRVLQSVLAIYGLAVLAFSVRNAIVQPETFWNLESLRGFLVAPVLTVLFLPFIYLFALLLLYEQIFVTLQLQAADAEVVRHAKRRVIRKFHLRMRALSRWRKRTGWRTLRSRTDVDEWLAA